MQTLPTNQTNRYMPLHLACTAQFLYATLSISCLTGTNLRFSSSSGKRLCNPLSGWLSYYLYDHVLEQGFEDITGLVICYFLSHDSWNQGSNLLRDHFCCSNQWIKENHVRLWKTRILH